MLHKSRRGLCYFLICILFMAGLHTTYIKADTFAERAMTSKQSQIQEIKKLDDTVFKSPICRVERIHATVRTVLGQITIRINSGKRELRIFSFICYVLCMLAFYLRIWHIEEILYLHEEKYRTALIKYIHDLDGKKRIPCLI